MRCAECGFLLDNDDRVCYGCKRYVGRERASVAVRGTDYSKLLPVIFAVLTFGVVAIGYDQYYPSRSVVGFNSAKYIMCSWTAGIAVAVGWVVGKFVGDGSTCRV